jgi:hypothetical protein
MMSDTVDEESRAQLLAVEDKLNKIVGVTDASLQLLPETVDEISAMSHDANHRLLGLFSSVSNEIDPFR